METLILAFIRTNNKLTLSKKQLVHSVDLHSNIIISLTTHTNHQENKIVHCCIIKPLQKNELNK